MGRYQQEYRRSLTEPDRYWRAAAGLIDWYTEPATVLDSSGPPLYRWFTGGVLNTCFNAVDRHVRDGRAGQPALIYDSPVTGTQRVMTYRELLDEVARFAGVLTGLGVTAGDRVVIYMPMVPEAAGDDAGVCPDRRGSLGGVRRVRRGRARDADRGRQAGGDRDGVLWHRGEPGGGVQADPGPGDRALAA